MKKILVIIMVVISLFSLLVFGCACNKNSGSGVNTEVTNEENGGSTEDPGENGGNTEDPGENGGNTEDPGENGGNTEDPGENGGNTDDKGYTIVQPISNGGGFNGGNYN